MGQRLFVELQIQARAPVPQDRCEHFTEAIRPRRAIVPTPICYIELDPVLAQECCIDEFMIDASISQIDQFAMPQFGEQQVMEKLGRMPRSERLHGLELEGATPIDQNIKILNLLERAMSDLNRNLKLYAGIRVSQLALRLTI